MSDRPYVNRESTAGARVIWPATIVAVATMVLGADSAAWARYNYDREDPYVTPCSLVGVNPVYHPEIFGNPALARAYGFVKSRDGTWHVSCGPGPRRSVPRRN
jgi:hypothetical protein